MNTLRLRLLALPALLALSAVLTACAAPASGDGSAPPLRGTTWQLGADGPRAAHIRLDEKEARLTGFGGCNRLMGRFVLEDSRLRFEGLASTRRACIDDDNGSEDRFITALSGVRGWRIEGVVLKLLSEGGGTLLDLRPGKATP